MQNATRFIVKSGVIAGLYVVLSMAVFPVASGAIQFRVSEALTILPLFMLEAVPGLFVGCMLSNLITGCAVFDVIFGSLITLCASALTYMTGRIIKKMWVKILVGGLFPVILNAFLLPLIWIWCYGVIEYMYIIQVGFLLLSQSLVIYVIGTPLYIAMARIKAKGLLKI